MIEYLAMRIDEGALEYKNVIERIGNNKKNQLDKELINRGREDLIVEIND